MKYNWIDVFLFYLPLTCLFLLSPSVVNSWWKMNMFGPLVLLLIVSIILGIYLIKRIHRVSLTPRKQQPEFQLADLFSVQIQSELIIGQSDSDYQFSLDMFKDSFEVKIYELMGEGIAIIDCSQNEQRFEGDSVELLVDSGEIWLCDSALVDKEMGFDLLKENDPTVKLIVDSNQQTRGAIFIPPYGDGEYQMWINKNGFVIELIPGTREQLQKIILKNV